MEQVIAFVAIVAYIGFRQWLRHHRRIMIHRERMAAIEKGVDLPPVEQEVERSTWNVQRLLLLMGWIWVAMGIGTLVVLTAILLSPPTPQTQDIPRGAQFGALIPIGVGIAFLITYVVGAKRERRDGKN